MAKIQKLIPPTPRDSKVNFGAVVQDAIAKRGKAIDAWLKSKGIDPLK